MPYFHSDDSELAQYNGKKITERARWYEGLDHGDSLELWEIVEVEFEDGTVLTCFPCEVRDVHPYAEQFRCGECGDLALYRTDHKLSCSVHPEHERYVREQHYHTNPN